MKPFSLLKLAFLAAAFACLPAAAKPAIQSKPAVHAPAFKLNAKALLQKAGTSRLLLADWGEWCAHGGHGGNEPVIIILDAWGNCIEFCGDPPDCEEGIINKRMPVWVPSQPRPFTPVRQDQPKPGAKT